MPLLVLVGKVVEPHGGGEGAPPSSVEGEIQTFPFLASLGELAFIFSLFRSPLEITQDSGLCKISKENLISAFEVVCFQFIFISWLKLAPTTKKKHKQLKKKPHNFKNPYTACSSVRNSQRNILFVVPSLALKFSVSFVLVQTRYLYFCCSRMF